ncbi:hypothetical protein SDRG_02681 [Saprolegnia diclina VS20]|uniref:GPI inositol-deacylase n=1 Tax=Saprolegnia diclina (strain VS20) TaxID=1156394 RepID=T0SBB9_SAPDV|nr:hypothetical protein SDRG_02681 [Saprolegnia diclina VS20]EQC40022.1 hypothetical protein SDRG_02681 [Saprolegnia diclina VS20]|eukprot:XP_008606496.1 hypothetical protein SDRG_02681 [Saprolegnia diclina VS20]
MQSSRSPSLKKRPRMAPARSWGAPASVGVAVAVFVIFSVLFFVDLYATARLKNTCGMTYSSPVFTALPMPPATDTAMQHTHAKYTFSMLHVADDARLGQKLVSGVPLLFVPGHLASYKQARSYGQHFHELYRSHGDIKAGIDFFLVDFNEEATGLTGHFMAEQGYFINEAIKEILRQYAHLDAALRPTSVIVLAHSMGGIAVRTAMTLPNYMPSSILTMVTLSTPHMQPPFPLDSKMANVYASMNNAWRAFANSCNESACTNTVFEDVVVVSIAGGHRDLVIHSSLASLESLLPPSHGLALLTSAMPSVQTSMDHLCLLWCHELLQTITSALHALIDPTARRIVARRQVRYDILHRSLLDEAPPSLTVPGFATSERDMYPTWTPLVLSDLSRTHYILVFPVLFGISVAILATQLERWQLQVADTATFTTLLAPTQHWCYPLQHARAIDVPSPAIGAGLAAALLSLYYMDAIESILCYSYVYLYVLGCVFCLSQTLGRVLRPFTYSAARCSTLFTPAVLSTAVIMIVFGVAHGVYGLSLDVSRELALVCLSTLGTHVLAWISLLLLPSRSPGLAAYQSTVFAIYAAVFPCWLGDAVYFVDVVRFPRAIELGFLSTVVWFVLLLGPCLRHVLLARKYYFPLPPAAMFGRMHGATLETPTTSTPDACNSCFVEDGGVGAVFMQATTSETVRIGSVIVGPTFRVVACDCGARFSSSVDYCDFCSRVCTECGGGEIAHQERRQFREYMHMMHETVVAHRSVCSLLWLVLFGGLGLAIVTCSAHYLVYLGACVGVVASAYHTGLRGALDVEDGLVVTPKSAETLMHEVQTPKAKTKKATQ